MSRQSMSVISTLHDSRQLRVTHASLLPGKIQKYYYRGDPNTGLALEMSNYYPNFGRHQIYAIETKRVSLDEYTPH